MNIIFVSNNMAKARTLSLPQCLLLLALLVSVPPLITAALILPQAPEEHQGAVHPSLPARFLNAVRQQQHINALAQQLGEIQARIMRLDALSARLSEMAGMPETKPAEPPPAQGGPMEHAIPQSAAEIDKQVAQLMVDLHERSQQFDALEQLILQQNLKKNTFPSGSPVDAMFNSSSYGWRPDPFTGQMAFHKGLDFMAEAGSPIYAAADGVVTQAERVSDYGNIVRVDHGFGLDTRYAHVSAFLVKVGDRVTKGQPIAEVGSTGRSTGAHLHFEVRLNGVPLDPRNYLKNSNG